MTAQKNFGISSSQFNPKTKQQKTDKRTGKEEIK